MKRKFREGLERLVKAGKNIGRTIRKNAKIGIMVLGASFGSYFIDKSVSNALGETSEGVLKIENFVNSQGGSNYVQINHFSEQTAPSISDGKDKWDAREFLYMPDRSGLYSEVNDNNTLWKFWKDYRPEDSSAPFNIKLVYNGRISDPVQNWLEFGFWYGDTYTFGNKPILFQQTSSTDPNAFYPVYDIRRAIAQNEGKVPLENLAAGTHGPGTMTADIDPYDDGVLTIGTRLLSDLNEDGKVDNVDFASFAQDWNATDVNSIADISGPNGIPDKNVDVYDLGVFAEDYLKDINEPNTW